MDSSVLPKDEIWFLRLCHRISTGLYIGKDFEQDRDLLRIAAPSLASETDEGGRDLSRDLYRVPTKHYPSLLG